MKKFLNKFIVVLFLIIFIIEIIFSSIYIFDSFFLLFERITHGSLVDPEVLLNIIIFIYELIIIPMGLFLFLHIPLALASRSYETAKINSSNQPKVSIIIPTAYPNILALEANFKKIKEILYKNYEVVVVDNSQNLKLVEKIKNLTNRYNVLFYHREAKKGFKSGNINYILDKIKSKYFLFIDIDQIIVPDSIINFVELLEADEKLAFVQAKYKIQNDNSIVRIAISIMYSYYYEILSRGKDFRKTVLFNGTTACFRRSAILAVNGFPDKTYCEDIDISNKLILSGFKSRFLNEYATTALVPWRLSDFISSTWRWAHGATSIVKVRTKEIFSSKKIGGITKVELFMNNLVWITGSGTILLAISLLIIYLGGWETLRPQYSISILHEIIIFDGFQFFALFFAFNTLIGSMVAVFGSNSLKWFLVLPVYFIATLSLFFFIFPAVISAIFNKNLPSDSRSEWNKRLNYNLYGLFMIPYGLINLLIGLEALFKMNLIGLFFIMIAISTITPFLFLIFDRFTNIKKLEQEYFEQFL